jgi:hypothetical protein
MNFSFFLENNTSGHKTREVWFSKNHKDVYDKIIHHSNTYDLNNHSFKEKIWNYFHNIITKPKCGGCDNIVTFTDRFDRGYNKFCSLNCANDSGKLLDLVKIKMKETWGVEYFSQHSTFKEKVKETKLKRYGDENYTNSVKSKKTRLKKYGDENYVNKEKAVETSLKKYGVSNPSKSKIIKDKIIENNIIKWGFKSPSSHPDVILKKEKTILQNIKNRFKENEFITYEPKIKEFTLLCDKCNQDYKIFSPLYNERRRLGYETCINCNPINSLSSHREKEVYDYLLELGISNIERNTRKIISPLELDLYLPEHKIGIEFNGLYYHSDLFKSENYHLNKYDKCLELGIELIQIFEDEWLFKKEIVKSIVKNRLGKIENKIYGRKCVVKEINKKDSSEFLMNNHIQGNCISKVKLGLYHNEQLVSVMTFGTRSGVGNNKGEYSELLRFSNLINYNVIGGGSKLFNHYIKNYNPKMILSYSDNRLFGGGLYKNLGFEYIHKSKPNYYYTKNELRFHRLNYKKKNLVKSGFDKNKTEKLIMSERGFNRIYDCGVTRWEWKM